MNEQLIESIESFANAIYHFADIHCFYRRGFANEEEMGAIENLVEKAGALKEVATQLRVQLMDGGLPASDMTRKQMDEELASGRALKGELMKRMMFLPASDGVWQAIDGLLQERWAKKLSEECPPGEEYEVTGGLNEGRK